MLSELLPIYNMQNYNIEKVVSDYINNRLFMKTEEDYNDSYCLHIIYMYKFRDNDHCFLRVH